MILEFIDTNKFLELLKGDNTEIVDIRNEDEYSIAHIPGSKSIPMCCLEENVSDIDWDKDVVLICRGGFRSKTMSCLLASPGRKIKNLKDGLKGVYKVAPERLNISCDFDELEKYFS